ncbi:hypothetical protein CAUPRSCDRAFT_12534 [Caulochytrium protostelioides]|uniref:Uncharacterized protein n=1 Tax=Caulochytrium protostelioides TaxID=1555241 RepID=A0A4V1IT44_9FUNG|nr:hypothetical protein CAUPRSCDRAFT_12534 [Caulochytrium protostelioides]
MLPPPLLLLLLRIRSSDGNEGDRRMAVHAQSRRTINRSPQASGGVSDHRIEGSRRTRVRKKDARMGHRQAKPRRGRLLGKGRERRDALTDMERSPPLPATFSTARVEVAAAQGSPSRGPCWHLTCTPIFGGAPEGSPTEAASILTASDVQRGMEVAVHQLGVSGFMAVGSFIPQQPTNRGSLAPALAGFQDHMRLGIHADLAGVAGVGSAEETPARARRGGLTCVGPV